MMLAGPPAWVAGIICKHLQHLHRVAPPRVCAAALRTIFNGWCTERRHQRCGGVGDICYLGCGKEGCDSIEHYCRCPLGLEILRQRLNIILPGQDALAFFVLAHSAQEVDDVLALGSLYIYAVYVTTNYYRHHGLRDRSHIKECLKQHIIQGCEGHAGLMSRFGACWTRPVHRI